MINTNKKVGFYTDVFGNEIDEYEQIEKYTVWYEGNCSKVTLKGLMNIIMINGKMQSLFITPMEI